MKWYNYIGWVFVGIFIVFIGWGIFGGIDESADVIPIVIILAFIVYLVL